MYLTIISSAERTAVTRRGDELICIHADVYFAHFLQNDAFFLNQLECTASLLSDRKVIFHRRTGNV